jgi:hypothetical protein
MEIVFTQKLIALANISRNSITLQKGKNFHPPRFYLYYSELQSFFLCLALQDCLQQRAAQRLYPKNKITLSLPWLVLRSF